MIDLLRSVRLTLATLAAIALMSVWGTLAPHRNVYYHPLYLGALCLLGLNVLLCLTSRLTYLKSGFTLKKGGFLLSHAGILVILAGALTSLLFGTRTLVWLGPTDTVEQLPTRRHTFVPLGFTMTLQQFVMDIHPSGIPDYYISHVTVNEPDRPARPVAIAVNHPFRLNKYRVFQSGYRLRAYQQVRLAIVAMDEESRIVDLTVPGEPVRIKTDECSTLLVKGLRYEPHFFMAGPQVIGSRTLQPNNPAVQVLFQCDGNEPETGWLFLQRDMFRDTAGGYETQIALVSVDHTYETGLEFVRDPGVIWVLIGAFLLTGGLMLYLVCGFHAGGKSL